MSERCGRVRTGLSGRGSGGRRSLSPQRPRMPTLRGAGGVRCRRCPCSVVMIRSGRWTAPRPGPSAAATGSSPPSPSGVADRGRPRRVHLVDARGRRRAAALEARDLLTRGGPDDPGPRRPRASPRPPPAPPRYDGRHAVHHRPAATRPARARGGSMRTLIANGTVVTADGSYDADVLVDGETIAQIGGGPGGERGDRGRDHRRGGQVRDPGRDRRPHPHGAAVRRHLREGHVRDRDARGRVRRDDVRRGLRGPVEGPEPARGPRRLAREGRGERGRRLRVPHDHERRQRRHARRDGPAGRRGHPRLQAVHGLPGRVLQRRRRDLPGDAADRRRTAA